MTKAIISLTSFNDEFYANKDKTGVYVVEALHPFKLFEKNGIDVTFVSEKGTFGWDVHSLAPDALSGEDREIFENPSSTFMKKLGEVKKPSEVDAKNYNLFFAAGGHGALFDFPTASGLQSLLISIYERNGVVGAVCHGPCILEGARCSNGEYLAKGKKVTGFTDEGENIVGVSHIMKELKLKTPREGLEEIGATYVHTNTGPFGCFSVADGRLITGVNPASGTETAQKCLDALA